MKPGPLLFAFSVPVLLSAESPESLLKRVDRLRYPWPSFCMEVSLQSGKTQQQWRVQVRENGDARVEGLSEKEKGRTVLLLGDEMWLLLPKAKNPVKVSPQQRMLGPAAGGDIARFRFAADYAPLSETETTLDGKPCHRLELQAKRNTLNYRTATLWVADGRPLRAEFFLASGKLARRVLFGNVRTTHGIQVITNMILEEPSGQRAELQFEDWKPSKIDDNLFQLPPRQP